MGDIKKAASFMSMRPCLGMLACFSLFLEVSTEVTEYLVFDAAWWCYVVAASQRFDSFSFFFGEGLWHVDGYVDDFIAFLMSVAVDVWDSFAFQAQDCSRLCSCWDADFGLAVVSWHFKRRAKYCLWNG